MTRHSIEAAVAYTDRSPQDVSQMEKPRVIRIMEFCWYPLVLSSKRKCKWFDPPTRLIRLDTF